MVATLLQGCVGKEWVCSCLERSHCQWVTEKLMPGCWLAGHPFCMASRPDMCKCRVCGKRLVQPQDEEAKRDVTAVPSCLMGFTGKKEPDSSQRCAVKISTP